MTIYRGDIYFVNLNPIQGKEQAGTRPVLVISIDTLNQLPLVVTVIVGTKGENIKKDFLTNVRVFPEESGLPIETVFLCFQIRSLDKRRFPNQRMGRLSAEKMLEVENTVRYCLGL